MSLRLPALFALALAACGAPPKTPPSLPPLHLAPTTDLAPAAGLILMLDVKPRAIFSHVELARAFASVVTDHDFRHIEDQIAGADPRELQELVIAEYEKTTLVLERGTIDTARVEKRFTETLDVEGRGVDRQSDALGTIVRIWGARAGGGREQIAFFGRELVALERGQFGPLRTAELFAEERLKRAAPALRVDPLSQAAARFADAPLVIYAAGPFDDSMKKGFGGLLAGSTAVAVAVRPADSDRGHDGDLLAVTIALYGSWGADADTAASRLAATVHLLQESAIGRLCGADHPIVGPTPHASASEISVALTLNTEALFRGLRNATSAGVSEILGQ